MTNETKLNFTIEGDDQISCNVPCRGKYVNSSSGEILISGIVPFKKFKKICVHQQAPRQNVGERMSAELAKIAGARRECKIYS